MGTEPLGANAAIDVQALPARRLMALTALFVAALAAIFVGKVREETNAREVETRLRLSQAAIACSETMNLAAVTGGEAASALSACYAGGASTAYFVSNGGDVLSMAGAGPGPELNSGVIRSLPLSRVGDETLDLPGDAVRASWRPLDRGGVVLVAAPAKDMYERTPPYVTYILLLAAIALVSMSLMAAFIRQTRASDRAAEALNQLKLSNDALTAGRTSPWRFDPDARSVSFAKSFLEPLGLGVRDRLFSLREISALVHPEDLRTALSIFSGETAGALDGVVRLRNPQGGWSRAYFRTSTDATRLKRAGVAVDLSGADTFSPAAAIAQTRLKDAIESISEAFVLWDGEGKLAAWNKRFATIFQLGRGAIKPGMSARQVCETARAGGDIILKYFAPDAAIDEQSIEVELPRDRWLNISRRRTAEGGMVCVASNVTDLKRRSRAQKRKERELQETVTDLQKSRRELSVTMQKYQVEKHRAEDANRAKSEFLANMSHELRTPLNAINGFSEIMKSELYGPIGDPKYKEYVTDILTSGQHLLELIDDVLDMSKIEAGRVRLEPGRVELERVLQECARLVAKRAKDAGVTLNIAVAHAPAAFADARAVKQVILNLLSNALKFTPDNGEVSLTVEADLDSVAVIISDSGVGIEAEHLSRLGAPFEVADDQFSMSRRGSGLGLALSTSLMQLQGGLLGIASEPRKGTIACAVFPRRSGVKVRLPQFMRQDARTLVSDRAFAPFEGKKKAARPAPTIQLQRASGRPEAAE